MDLLIATEMCDAIGDSFSNSPRAVFQGYIVHGRVSSDRDETHSWPGVGIRSSQDFHEAKSSCIHMGR